MSIISTKLADVIYGCSLSLFPFLSNIIGHDVGGIDANNDGIRYSIVADYLYFINGTCPGVYRVS